MSTTGRRIVIRGGTVLDGLRPLSRTADVAIAGDTITAVGDISRQADDVELDASGRLVMPGFVDAHAHVEGVVFDEAVQLALLRQGITSAVTGQDGVSYAPGDGRWASEYFASINGTHPTFDGGGVGELLATYDGTIPLNIGYLVPAGTVRHAVMGMSDAPAGDEELALMCGIVRKGLAEGALGLSTGLDYVPGIFAGAEELAALCEPVAEAGALYVTHMRGGYEKNSAEGTREIAAICARSGVSAHISHFHVDAEDGEALLDELADHGIDVTFDMYPYTRGASLLSMATLPPEYSALPAEEAAARLTEEGERARLRESWFPQVALKPSLGPGWPRMIALSAMPAAGWEWCPGLTIEQIARRLGTDEVDATLSLLIASGMQASAVMAVRRERPLDELGRLFRHASHTGGSDGIFIGAVPHPRAHGAFARYLATMIGDWWTWESAAAHLSGLPASRFGLGRRGAARPGWRADLCIVDPADVADRATYAEPRRLATGIDEVLVAGVPVLRDGELTGARSGRGLRRTAG